MPYIFFGAPIVGVLTALAAIVAEQLMAIIASLIVKKEIILNVYTNLSFFLVAAALIEESLKYFSIRHILRSNFQLRRFRFIFSAILAGLFFALTEIYFILLTNGKKIQDVKSLGSETLFSLGAVLVVHLLTALLIAVLVATRSEEEKNGPLSALRTIIPPAFIHLLFNFLITQKGDYTNWLVGIVFGITFVVTSSILLFNLRHLD